LPISKHPENFCMPCCFKKMGAIEKTQENCYKALLRKEGDV
jgi:hypothetical protein